MFSTNLTKNSYVVVCIANGAVVKLVDTIVDTGAARTCYRARNIDRKLTETDVADNPHIDICGFVDKTSPENAVRFYKYPVKQFTIGTIDLGKQDIWITFDKRISDNLLGLDILQKVTFLQIANSHSLSFFDDMDDFNKFVSQLQESLIEK